MAKKSVRSVFLKEYEVVKYRWEFFIRKGGNEKKVNRLLFLLLQNTPELAISYRGTVKTQIQMAADYLKKLFDRFLELEKNKETVKLTEELMNELGPFHTWLPYFSLRIFKNAKRRKDPLSKYTTSMLFAFNKILADKGLLLGRTGYVPAISLSYNPVFKTLPKKELNKKAEDFYPDPIIDMRLDLTFPKEDILAHLNYQLDAYKKMFNLDKIDAEKRKRTDIYDKYLGVWDMRKEGKSWPTIAKTIFTKTFECNDENSIRKVQFYFDRCDKLIKGGYKKIK